MQKYNFLLSFLTNNTENANRKQFNQMKFFARYLSKYYHNT